MKAKLKNIIFAIFTIFLTRNNLIVGHSLSLYGRLSHQSRSRFDYWQDDPEQNSLEQLSSKEEGEMSMDDKDILSRETHEAQENNLIDMADQQNYDLKHINLDAYDPQKLQEGISFIDKLLDKNNGNIVRFAGQEMG